MKSFFALVLCLVCLGVANAQLKAPAGRGLEKSTEMLVNLVQIFAEKS